MPEWECECKEYYRKWEVAYLDSIPSSWRSLFAVWVNSIREKSLQELVAATSHKIQQVFDKRVLVLVGHASDIVHHIPSVMPDQELGASSFEMRVRRKHRSSLNEAIVSC